MYRVLYLEFSQETNSFNPLIWEKCEFEKYKCCEGDEIFTIDRSIRCETTGFMQAAEDNDAELIGTVAMWAQSGGPVNAAVMDDMLQKVRKVHERCGHIDAVFAALHGATQDTREPDTCGFITESLRKIVGPDVVIAVAFDMHGNITDKILRNVDVACGYHTYPHQDAYETAYRAATLALKKVQDRNAFTTAAVLLPMIVPAAGYTSEGGPFKEVLDKGHAYVADGTLLDFTVFQLQSWLDADPAATTVLAVARDAETAARCAKELAQELFDRRKFFWPELHSMDEVLDRALCPEAKKPVVLVNAGDSPGGGACGDSNAVLRRLLERGDKLRYVTLLRDGQAVEQAFAIGVGNSGEMTLGAAINQIGQQPLTAQATVRSLHDGAWLQEGPISAGLPQDNGRSAVVSIGDYDILVSESLANTGDPQCYRHFGLEPIFYDVVEVKANMSFRLPFSVFATEFYTTEVPGVVGTSVLTELPFRRLPRTMYPFEALDDFQVEEVKLY